MKVLDYSALALTGNTLALGKFHMRATPSDELNVVLPQIHEPSSNPAGKFLGRVLLLLHRHCSDLLFEYVGCKYRFLAPVRSYCSNLFVPVKIFPYALNIALLFQRFHLQPDGSLYRVPVPIKSDGA